MKLLSKFGHDESAATAIEYGLIVALISVAMLGGINSFREELLAMWTLIGDTVD